MVAFSPPANGFGNSNFREPFADVPVPKSCTCTALVSSGYIVILFTFSVTAGITEGKFYGYSVAIPYTKPCSCN